MNETAKALPQLLEIVGIDWLHSIQEVEEMIEDWQVKEHEDKYYCQYYFDDNFARCDYDEEYYPSDEVVYSERWDRSLHQSNATYMDYLEDYVSDDEETAYCEATNQTVMEEHTLQLANGDLVLTYDYIEFDEYEIVHQEDTGEYARQGNSYYNEEDWDRYSQPQSILHSYSYKPRADFRSVWEEKKIYFWLELEYNNLDNDDFKESRDWDDLFYPKEDSSLDDWVELVSHPFTAKRYQQNKGQIKKIMKLARDCWGETQSSNTGLHIHISKNVIWQHTFQRIEEFLLSDRSKTQRLAGREANRRCVYEQGYRVSKLWRKKHREGVAKYRLMNRRNSETVELRLYRNSNKEIHTLGRIEFTILLVSLARQNKLSRENILKSATRKKYENLYYLLIEKNFLAPHLNLQCV